MKGYAMTIYIMESLQIECGSLNQGFPSFTPSVFVAAATVAEVVPFWNALCRE